MEQSKKKKGKKRIVRLIVIIAVIAVVLVIAVRACSSAMSGVVMPGNGFTYGEVSVQNLTNYVNVSGIVSSSNTINITGNVDQKVSALNVKVGDSVKKGDILCEFDSSSLQEEYERLEKSSERTQGAEDYSHSLNVRNLNKAKSDKADALNKAQQSIDSAEKKRDKAYDDYNKKVDEYNRLNKEADELYNEIQNEKSQYDEVQSFDGAELAEWGYTGTEVPDIYKESEKETRYQELKAKAEAINSALEALEEQLSVYDDAVDAAYDSYREIEKSADSMIQSAQDSIDAEKYSASDDSMDSQLKKLQERIDECIVKAPQDGVVTQLNVTEGSIPMTANIIVLENTDELIITGKVNESDILKVEEGLPAEIKTSATEDEIISGKVKRIEKIISSGGMESAGGYTVEISVDDKDSKLLIGMSASVKIILSRQDNALSVPYDAVQGGENGGYFVFAAVPSENGMYRVEQRTVTTGFEGDYYTEITSGDLKEGDIVLTSPSNVADGDIIPLPVSGVQS